MTVVLIRSFKTRFGTSYTLTHYEIEGKNTIVQNFKKKKIKIKI
jgi:hypothetical protein